MRCHHTSSLRLRNFCRSRIASAACSQQARRCLEHAHMTRSLIKRSKTFTTPWVTKRSTGTWISPSCTLSEPRCWKETKRRLVCYSGSANTSGWMRFALSDKASMQRACPERALWQQWSSRSRVCTTRVIRLGAGGLTEQSVWSFSCSALAFVQLSVVPHGECSWDTEPECWVIILFWDEALHRPMLKWLVRLMILCPQKTFSRDHKGERSQYDTCRQNSFLRAVSIPKGRH